VTVPQVHADGTTSDGGFVKKLVIQDVPGEDGSKAKESLLWAGLEITDSDLKKKLDEKSIRGVSGGILFDYAAHRGRQEVRPGPLARDGHQLALDRRDGRLQGQAARGRHGLRARRPRDRRGGVRVEGYG
jgi:hypothetical protein